MKKEIKKATFKYTAFRFFLYLLFILISIIYLFPLLYTSFNIHDLSASIKWLVIWILVSGAAFFLLTVYAAYIVKVEKIAHIAEYVKRGQDPAWRMKDAYAAVKSRFGKVHACFLVDRIANRVIEGANLSMLGGAGEWITKEFGQTTIGLADEYVLCASFFNEGSIGEVAEKTLNLVKDNVGRGLKRSTVNTLKSTGITFVAFFASLITLVPIAVLIANGVVQQLMFASIAAVIACAISAIVKTVFVNDMVMTDLMIDFSEICNGECLNKVD